MPISHDRLASREFGYAGTRRPIWRFNCRGTVSPAKLWQGVGLAGEPVLHVGLHNGHQQHAVAASAQRVRAQLFPDNTDRIGVVHRLWRHGYALGIPDRTDRLQERAYPGAGGHGARFVGDDWRSRDDFLSRDAGFAVCHRQRHYAAAGGGQPLCRGYRTAGKLRIAADAGAGVQFDGHVLCALFRGLPHSQPHHGRNLARGNATDGCRTDFPTPKRPNCPTFW